MAEYAGYVATAPVNYGAITDGLVSNIIAIDQAKREEDKKSQLEFDKYFDSTTKDALKDYGLSKSQTWNDATYPIADGAKKVLLAAQRSGSKQQVNLVTSNIKTSLSNIKAAKDAVDTNMATLEKMTLEGQISPMGDVYGDMYASALNFKNKGFPVLPDGTIPYVSYDERGNILSTNDIMDPATVAKAAPFIDKKIDYEKDLNTWAGGLGTFKDEQGRVTTVSPSLNPAFPKAKETKITELTSTPRNSARFLSSVAGYRGYSSEAAKRELLDSGISEDKLIPVRLVNGVPQPILSDEQQAAAKEIAAQQIDQRIGVQRTMESGRTGSGGMSGIEAWLYKQGIIDAKKERIEARKEAKIMAPKVKLVKNVENLFTTTNSGDFATLKQTASKLKGWKLVSVNNNDGDIVIFGQPKGASSTSDLKELARFNSPSQLYAFMSGKENLPEAESEFDYTRDYMLGAAPDTEPARPQSAAPAAKAPKEQIYIDIKATIDLAKKAGKTITAQQIKAQAMKKNPDKKILWTNEK